MGKSSERTNITVSIKDMLLYLCSRWRVLIIWLIIGAVLGGAYSGYKSLKSGNAAKSASVYENMSETDKKSAQINTTTFIHYMNQFDFYSAYSENSLFQKLNPETAKVGVLTYFIESSDESALLDNIVRTYAANVTDDAFAADVAEAFGIPKEEAFYYYDGIVRVGDTVTIKTTENKTTTEVTGLINPPLIIRVYGADDEFVLKMMEAVKASVERLNESVTKSAGIHNVELISETVKKNDDTYIFDRQEAYVVNMREVTESSELLKEELDNDMLAAVEYLISEQYEGEYIDYVFPGSSEESGGSFHISKKWVIIGAIGLLILAALVIIIKYLAKGVVRCYDDIEYTYGIQVLGTYDDPKTASRAHKLGLDKWLKSLRIKRKSQDRDSSAALIARKLQLLAKNHGVQNVCVAIGPDVDTDESFMNDVIERAEGINVTVAPNILRNADAINKVLEADGVVLLEQMDKSRFSSIDEERVMCAGNNIRILGAIVAE